MELLEVEGDDGGGNEFDLANLGRRLLWLGWSVDVPPCWSNGVHRMVDSMAPMVQLYTTVSCYYNPARSKLMMGKIHDKEVGSRYFGNGHGVVRAYKNLK